MLAAPHGHVASWPAGTDVPTKCGRIPGSAAVGCRGYAVVGTCLLTRVVQVARTRPYSCTRSPLSNLSQTGPTLAFPLSVLYI